MTPFVDDPDFQLHVGDALEVLRELPAESVHCCVTSPPYWGLRDYGTGTWEGGDADCDHIGGTLGRQDAGRNFTGGGGNHEGSGNPGKQQYRDVCGKCGATRVDRQLGLEPTPDEYVANMVTVFREVRRVLRADGTLWLNIGDSYAPVNYGANAKLRQESPNSDKTLQGRVGHWAADIGGAHSQSMSKGAAANGIKQKDLCGIPWRLAFALQADGWYLRSDIIWSKPNPMPESVTDRPTKAHEYLFLLTRSPRYFYDADAIREPHAEPWRNGNAENSPRAPEEGLTTGRPSFSVNGRSYNEAGRNKRSVWEIATEAYPDAHFATFPQALVEPCVKAGCPEDGVVLDPFLGSGTTALVARRLGRKCVGIELNPDYAQLCAKRLQQLSLFASEHAEA